MKNLLILFTFALLSVGAFCSASNQELPSPQSDAFVLEGTVLNIGTNVPPVPPDVDGLL